MTEEGQKKRDEARHGAGQSAAEHAAYELTKAIRPAFEEADVYLDIGRGR